MPSRKARHAVAAIVRDLIDRSGLQQAWDDIDNDIQLDIRLAWERIIDEPAGGSVSAHELECEVRELRLRVASLEKRVTELEGKREPTGNLEAVIGKWPGDETDDEIFEMLEEIS